MPPPIAMPHCLLESWDTTARAWVTDHVKHESIAAATAAATGRGVYRVVCVSGDRRLETETFAVV